MQKQAKKSGAQQKMYKKNKRGVLKIRFFEADEILKPEFTVVNEDFKIEVQQRKSNFQKSRKAKTSKNKVTGDNFLSPAKKIRKFKLN